MNEETAIVPAVEPFLKGGSCVHLASGSKGVAGEFRQATRLPAKQRNDLQIDVGAGQAANPFVHDSVRDGRESLSDRTTSWSAARE
jgi:hypothetical protein